MAVIPYDWLFVGLFCMILYHYRYYSFFCHFVLLCTFLSRCLNFHHNKTILIVSMYLQMAAHRAFQFCKQYKRITEFRRLCEIIRNHLANLNKYRDQRDRPDLSAPESLQLYLDTRFEQLKIATELKLWQVGIM